MDVVFIDDDVARMNQFATAVSTGLDSLAKAKHLPGRVTFGRGFDDRADAKEIRFIVLQAPENDELGQFRLDHRCDCLISDLSFKGASGFEGLALAKRLVADGVLSSRKVMITTDKILSTVIEQIRPEGFAGCSKDTGSNEAAQWILAHYLNALGQPSSVPASGERLNRVFLRGALNALTHGDTWFFETSNGQQGSVEKGDRGALASRAHNDVNEFNCAGANRCSRNFEELKKRLKENGSDWDDPWRDLFIRAYSGEKTTKLLGRKTCPKLGAVDKPGWIDLKVTSPSGEEGMPKEGLKAFLPNEVVRMVLAEAAEHQDAKQVWATGFPLTGTSEVLLVVSHDGDGFKDEGALRRCVTSNRWTDALEFVNFFVIANIGEPGSQEAVAFEVVPCEIPERGPIRKLSVPRIEIDGYVVDVSARSGATYLFVSYSVPQLDH